MVGDGGIRGIVSLIGKNRVEEQTRAPARKPDYRLKTMTDKIKHSLDFVVRFYRPGAFRPDGWFIETPLPFWRRHAVAASIIGTVLVAAAAVTTYVVLDHHSPATHTAPVPTTESPSVEIPVAVEVATVEFENASLSEVVAAIENTYGVKVTGMSNTDTRLTLHYQGTAEDLVETINDLLGTNLKVEK